MQVRNGEARDSLATRCTSSPWKQEDGKTMAQLGLWMICSSSGEYGSELEGNVGDSDGKLRAKQVRRGP